MPAAAGYDVGSVPLAANTYTLADTAVVRTLSTNAKTLVTVEDTAEDCLPDREPVFATMATVVLLLLLQEATTTTSLAVTNMDVRLHKSRKLLYGHEAYRV